MSAGIVVTLLAACAGGDGPTPPPPTPQAASLRVTVTGLPAGAAGEVLVDGPVRVVVARDTVLSQLPVGEYLVTTRPVMVDGQAYADLSEPTRVRLAPAQVAGVLAEYRLRPTTVRVILTGVPITGPGDIATVPVTLIDSLGRTVTANGVTTARSGTVTAVRGGTYRVSVPEVTVASGIFLGDQVPATLVVAPGAEATLAVALRLVSGQLTVGFEEAPAGQGGARVVDSTGQVLGRVTAAAPTLERVRAGALRIIADTLTLPGGFQVVPREATTPVRVTVGQGSRAAVRYVGRPNAGFTVRLAGLDIVQAASSRTVEVPLVANRDALVRVTVLASGANAGVRPTVEVRVTGGDGTARVFRVPAARSFIPTTPALDTLNTTWNVIVPGALLQPGVGIGARLLADEVLGEGTHGAAQWPTSGGAVQPVVRTVAPLAVTLVPIQVDARVPALTQAEAERIMAGVRNLLPLEQIDVAARASIMGIGLGPTALIDTLLATRTADRASRTRLYVGLVGDRSSGIARFTATGTAVWVGTADSSAVIQLVAHEIAHVYGMFHAPSCQAPAVDPAFPYPDGRIGGWGWDQARGRLVPATHFDFMGYCGPQWISDFFWRAMLQRGSLGTPVR